MLKLSEVGFGLAEVSLNSLTHALDVESILDEAEALMLNRIRTRFLAESGPDGKWKPSAAGLLRKSGGYTTRGGKKYSWTGTLFETGTLFHSIQAFREDDNTRGIGTDVPYSVYLQNGTAKMPPRVFLGFNDEDMSLMVRLVIMRIEEVLW